MRLAAAGLFKHMGPEGANSYPSQRTLSDETHLARSTVQKALADLCGDGWLHRREIGRGQYGKPRFVYEAMIPNEGDRVGNDTSNGPAAGPIGTLANGPAGARDWTSPAQSLDRSSVLNQVTHREPVMERPRRRPAQKYECESGDSKRKRDLREWTRNAIATGISQYEAERMAPADLRYHGYDRDIAATYLEARAA